MAVVDHAFQQVPYTHYPIHEMVELCEFSLREGMPAVGGPVTLRVTGPSGAKEFWMTMLCKT
jgi:hypothetical protein